MVDWKENEKRQAEAVADVPTDLSTLVNDPIGEIIRLRAENAQLRELLKECSDDLAEWVVAHYGSRWNYPSEQRRYERDMGAVHRARAMLEPAPPQDSGQ